MGRFYTAFCFAGLFVTASGCAVHYYSQKTQTEHVWGIGHMKMKAAPHSEGLQAIVHGTDVLGFSVGKADRHTYTTLGWHRLEFIDIHQADTAIRLERPKGGFLNVRVGSKFPLGPPASRTNESASIHFPETRPTPLGHLTEQPPNHHTPHEPN